MKPKLHFVAGLTEIVWNRCSNAITVDTRSGVQYNLNFNFKLVRTPHNTPDSGRIFNNNLVF